MATSLSDKEIDSLRDGSFEIDCPQMELMDRREAPKRYAGTGYIRQTSSGNFEFKLFADALDLSHAERLGVYSGGKSGQIIDEGEMFTLTAADLGGRRFVATRILPSMRSGPDASRAVITGKLDRLDLSYTPAITYKTPHLELWYFGKFDLPCNLGVTTTTVVDEEHGSHNQRLEAAKVTNDHGSFLFHNTSKGVLVHFTPKDVSKKHEFFAARITETLEFMLGRVLEWSVAHYLEGDLCHVAITGRRNPRNPKHPKPPIEVRIIDHSGCFWSLFEKYLATISMSAGSNRHAIAQHVRSVIAMGDATVNAKALNLAVAIEGLLKVAVPKVPTDQQISEDKWNKAKDAIVSAELDELVKKRILGAVGAMNQTSAVDRMRHLVGLAVLDKADLKMWESLRHPAVHADADWAEVSQELITGIDQLLTIFYRLIFHGIGYTGKYTDYSTLGWPLSDFHGPAAAS